ncbi:uncharacterized protein FA14DRAFT_51973 [Meira miltonrushii]|uniref:Uncharacterized protein n=1 Tax=Meira miltonrushii TaxID=1280837 RepID=A0A316VF21_9BASI|nr:uncharacterized protein FA14DRAFT_51973 [Meira miltonrushii]PWN36116.1 hypothetical protein FA14DRAFT_51973 [Meira miltonrushii]
MLDILCATFLETLSFACLSCGQECRSARDSSGCCQTCCSPCASCCCKSSMESQEGRLRLEEDATENNNPTITQQPRWSAQEALRNWK